MFKPYQISVSKEALGFLVKACSALRTKKQYAAKASRKNKKG